MLRTAPPPRSSASRTARQQAEARRSVTFDACVGQDIDAHQIEWKKPKHRQQWANTLKNYELEP
jgi:hypothetical protein